MKHMKPISETISEIGGIVCTSELSKAEYKRLRRAIKKGEVIKLRRGVYASASSLMNTMIDVERVVPDGVVCLYNAWAYHQLCTTVPPAFCIAIEAKRKINIANEIPISIYYWKKEYLEFGIQQYTISQFQIRMTNPERSVCDAIRYRNKVGLDICAEVVRSYLVRNGRNISLLMEYAKKLRVANILNTYLEISLQ